MYSRKALVATTSDGVVPGERLAHLLAPPRQVAREERMVLREAGTAREGLLPDRGAEPLRERDDPVEGPLTLVAAADHERRRARPVQQCRQRAELGSGGRGAEQHAVRPARRVGVRRRVPVAHRHDDDRRSAGGPRLMVGASYRPGNVLGLHRKARPHGVFAGQALERTAGEKRLVGELAAVLLADQDDERGSAVASVGDRVDRVAQTRCRVQVDERRPAARDRVPRCDPDHRTLVQPQHELDVVRQPGQKRDLGRPRDCRTPSSSRRTASPPGPRHGRWPSRRHAITYAVCTIGHTAYET